MMIDKFIKLIVISHFLIGYSSANKGVSLMKLMKIEIKFTALVDNDGMETETENGNANINWKRKVETQTLIGNGKLKRKH